MNRSQYIQRDSEKNGFHDIIKFIPKTTNTRTNKRKSIKCKIIWFNPPYCLSVKTSVGRISLKLTKKHFPKVNRLNKTFSKNTVWVTSTILSHNKNNFNPVSDTEYGCNCRYKESCQLQNKCLTPKIVYRADVKIPTNDEKSFSFELQSTF